MNIEQVVRKAIGMEEEGYEFYKKAEGRTTSQLGKEMYAFLAEYEVHHKKLLKGLLKNVPPDAKTLDIPLPKEKLRSVFARASRNIEKSVPATADDIDALTFAMGKETESFKMYREAEKDSGDPRVKAMFARMAQEEEQHYDILEQTRYYLKEYANWTLWEENGPIEGG